MKKLLLGAVLALIAGTASAGEFAVKGIRFGMSKGEVVKITKATWGGKPCDQVLCAFWGDFTIAGLEGWKGEFIGDRLEMISNKVETAQMQEIMERFTGAYGKPLMFKEFFFITKSYQKVPNFCATWVVKDAVIEITGNLGDGNGRIAFYNGEIYVGILKDMVRKYEQSNKDF